jgi:hypothetical protein
VGPSFQIFNRLPLLWGLREPRCAPTPLTHAVSVALVCQAWYQPETKCPEDAESVPGPRAAHSCNLIGSCLYIFGGWNGKKGLTDLHVLNVETMVWYVTCSRMCAWLTTKCSRVLLRRLATCRCCARAARPSSLLMGRNASRGLFTSRGFSRCRPLHDGPAARAALPPCVAHL